MGNKSQKTLNKIWDEIFPYFPKVGDYVRLPYGKVDWIVAMIFPEGLIRLSRKARKKNPYSSNYIELPWTTSIVVDKRQKMRKVK